MLKRFLKDKKGTTAIEYALIGTLVSVAIIGGASAVGTSATVTLANIADYLVAAVDTP